MRCGHALFGEEVVIRIKLLWIIRLVIFLLISLEGDKRPDKINQNPESLNFLCPKQENIVKIFRVPPLIKKIIYLFAAGLGGFPTYLHMTNF